MPFITLPVALTGVPLPTEGSEVVRCPSRGGKMHLLSGAIEPNHPAEAISESGQVNLREAIHLVLGGIHATRRNLGQQRLPDKAQSAQSRSDPQLEGFWLARPDREFVIVAAGNEAVRLDLRW
jgi:hypothetical protein